MSQFEEPTMLAKFDRSFGDTKEELRLEAGEFNGSPTYALRRYFMGRDGRWRWVSQKPTQSGQCWERLNLKARELRALGEALILASEKAPAPDFRATAPRARTVSAPAAELASAGFDDIPF